ncbi:hypothetical protein VNO77_03711 [Canavalia gladiata]|uniref:Uncharacterized protein n=1 Tax=Canavalia gladiata TaxID=3824 RepID=A0AAN9R464_CANGL
MGGGIPLNIVFLEDEKKVDLDIMETRRRRVTLRTRAFELQPTHRTLNGTPRHIATIEGIQTKTNAAVPNCRNRNRNRMILAMV